MLTVYGMPASSPTNKVRYVANYLNLAYELKPVNLAAGEHRKPEFLQVNPYGKIPAISDNGFTLAESNAIIRYLADKQPTALYPRDLQQRAKIDQWIDYATQHVAIPSSKIFFNTYIYKLRGVSQDERSLADGREFLKANLPVVEQQLTHQPFIAGQTVTLGDIALLAALDVSEVCDVDLTPYTHISKWRNKLMQEKFYQSCHKNYAETFNKVFGHLAK